jgi:hypothetical protein
MEPTTTDLIFWLVMSSIGIAGTGLVFWLMFRR